MAKKETKNMVRRIGEMAAGMALGTVFGIPLAAWVKSKLGV